MRYPEIIFRTLAGPVVYVLVLVGVHFFLRGHNAPGGGFIAGLIVAVAALLERMSVGSRLLSSPPKRLVPTGLLIAFATGVVPMFLGYSFLKSTFGYVTFPFLGEVELASAALFDLGVFFVVVGTTLTIINLLSESADEPQYVAVREDPLKDQQVQAEVPASELEREPA